MRVLQGLLILLIIILSAMIYILIQPSPPQKVDVSHELPEDYSFSRALAGSQIDNAMYNLKCCGFENVTAADTAKSLNATFLSHSSCGTAQAVRIGVDNKLRIRMDGNDPTVAGAGEEWGDTDATGQPLWIFWPDNLSNTKYTRFVAGTTSTMAIHYYYLR